jgi:hypothetical protein
MEGGKRGNIQRGRMSSIDDSKRFRNMQNTLRFVGRAVWDLSGAKRGNVAWGKGLYRHRKGKRFLPRFCATVVFVVSFPEDKMKRKYATASLPHSRCSRVVNIQFLLEG